MQKFKLWVATKPIPDKASHPNFPHVQSLEYAENTDEPRQCCKTQAQQQKCSRKNGKWRRPARGKKGLSGRVALSGRGWLWVIWKLAKWQQIRIFSMCCQFFSYFLDLEVLLFCSWPTRSQANWGARLRGRTATQPSKKSSGKVLVGRVLGKGSQKGSEKGACCGLYFWEGFWEGFSEVVLRRGFSEGVKNAPLESTALSTPPLGVRPAQVAARRGSNHN